MLKSESKRPFVAGVIAACLLAAPLWGQEAGRRTAAAPSFTEDRRTAEQVKSDLSEILKRYPPSLKGVVALDPTLLANSAYLAPYPALAIFLQDHPEVAKDPAFYVGTGTDATLENPAHVAANTWRNILQALAVFAGFGMAIGLLVWLIRTAVDYRRWSRLAKVQTEVHSKILDRITGNEDLLAYIKSPAGSKFLESAPINLDSSPRSLGAPMGRILWSVQGGVVLLAAGLGMFIIGGYADAVVSQEVRALGVLAIAIGLGFVVSAVISYLISRRFGLIQPAEVPPSEAPLA
jgi:hypothetical protein